MIDCNFIAMNNADDILPYKPYKSGLIDGQSTINEYAYPSTRYPIVNLPFILRDFEHNTLLPGHYQVVLAPNRKTLYLVESNKIKAAIPVTKLVEKIVNEDEEREKLMKREKIEKKYRNNPRKRPRDTTEDEVQADMEANIEDPDDYYYILNYKNGNIQAAGYIFK
jgi:hypothetical protein